MRTAIIYTVCIAALVAVFILLGGPSAVSGWMARMNLLPKEEALTELYFETPLPKVERLSPGTVVPFSFVIRNLEGKDLTYTYRVSVVVGTITVPVAEGVVMLMNTERTTIKVPYVFRSSPEKATFFVEIINPRPQHIHFAVPGRQ